MCIRDRAGDEQGAGGVAGDVQSRTAHIEQLVDTGNDGDTFDRQADLRQDHRQHDHASAGDTRGTDGSERRGQNDHGHIAERQLHAVAAGDEDRADGLIAVSYTHLDEQRVRVFVKELEVLFGASAALILCAAETAGFFAWREVAFALVCELCSRPVSYTHLDVYKRQRSSKSPLHRAP